MTVLNNVLLEGDLRAGKQAYCNGRLFHRRKTARDGVREFRGYQLVSDLCRSGRKQVQTVVTHRRYSLKVLLRCEQPEWLSFFLNDIKRQWRSYDDAFP
jgi:hypothetical protein